MTSNENAMKALVRYDPGDSKEARHANISIMDAEVGSSIREIALLYRNEIISKAYLH